MPRCTDRTAQLTAREGQVSERTLGERFGLDDDYLEDLIIDDGESFQTAGRLEEVLSNSIRSTWRCR